MGSHSVTKRIQDAGLVDSAEPPERGHFGRPRRMQGITAIGGAWVGRPHVVPAKDLQAGGVEQCQ